MVDYNNPKINKSLDITNSKKYFLIKLICLAILLAFIVITLGAYTRLTNAGLGCPDWPGCYGRLIVSSTIVNPTKAWTEMIHRYLAGSLAIAIFFVTIMTMYNNLYNKKYSFKHYILPILILFTLIFQALLGMWTVTLKLLPTVVMGHLLGGFCTISLLVLLLLSNFEFTNKHNLTKISKFIFLLTLLALIIQITLGGWTSANYAAIPCIDFPACNGQIFPSIDTMGALNPFNPLFTNTSIDYDGGILTNSMRMTIQLTHRFGALIFSAFLLLTVIMLKRFSKKNAISYYSNFANWLLFLLITQVSIGIINVKLALPLATAVLHNSIACLLLISLITLNYKVNIKAKNIIK